MTALTLGAYLRQVQSLVHDFTESAWTRREMIERINDARLDVSRDMQCVRELVTGVQLIENVDVYSFNNVVVGATITSRGSGYTTAHVVFGPPAAGGTQAFATATVVDDGTVNNIFMTQWGVRYTQVPALTIIGDGSGATAVPITMFNVFNVLSLSNLWNTMRYSLSYRSFTLFQAWARSLQAQGFKSYPGMFSILTGTKQLYLQPTPNQTYFSEWQVIRSAEPLVGLTDIDLEIDDPYCHAVQFKAAHYLLMKHQNFQQAEYYQQKYDAIVPRIIAGAGGVRIANPYNRSAFEKMRRA